MPALVRLTTMQMEAGEPTLLQALAPAAWVALQTFPSELLAGVKNRRLYWKYLHGVVSELLSLLDLAWAQLPDVLPVTLAQTAATQLQILANLPPGTERLRLSILQRLEAGLAAEAASRRGAGRMAGAPGEAGQGSEAQRQQAATGTGLG
jgi:hypothetical protein